ncbi:MAG: Asp-tRNA(Asn)/Glu-tRNA(Gln) amidotransferase subunit GatA [Deltaproteobacteria bacterium]|nr:MAG: Asp-tRNA(Asn)/Glu-tRNA(Gln) amidotransferase subunit GatA [Deltaproteobacteria bacterium]
MSTTAPQADAPVEGATWWAARVREGDMSAVEVIERHLERIRERDAAARAFLFVDEKGALERAAAVDRARADGAALGPLAGVPVALKDLFVTKSMPTTAGSRILEGYVPPYDGHAALALAGAGGVIVGKVTLDEFGMGSAGEHSSFAVAENPWSADHRVGGSSSGSAAAVAHGLVPAALGTDTGGSVRWPASCTNLVGLKPTYGRISRHGMIAFASSLDQAGPMARTVEDVATMLSILAGPDRHDATSLDTPVEDYVASCREPVRGRTVGVVRRAIDDDRVHPDVRASVQRALAALADAGVALVDVELPSMDLWVPTYYVICCAEAASNLARYDGMRYGRRVAGADLAETIERTRTEGFGPEVQRRILVGTFVLRKDSYDAYYGAAVRARARISAELDRALATCDALALPVSPEPAIPKAREADDPVTAYLRDVFTVAANLAGLPALSVPAGFATSDGATLPVGLQLVGRRLGEGPLLSLAGAVERILGAGRRRPGDKAP